MMKWSVRDYFQSYTVLMPFTVFEGEANKDEHGLSLNPNLSDIKELKLKQGPLHDLLIIISLSEEFSVMSHSNVKGI